MNPKEKKTESSEEQEKKPDTPEKLLSVETEDKRKLIIILEKAALETGKLNKKVELLNCDEHRKYISTKLKKDYSTYRPDITHQVKKSKKLLKLFPN